MEETQQEQRSTFMQVLAECIEAVSNGSIAEADVERELEGVSVLRVTIRNEPFRAS